MALAQTSLDRRSGPLWVASDGWREWSTAWARATGGAESRTATSWGIDARGRSAVWLLLLLSVLSMAAGVDRSTCSSNVTSGGGARARLAHAIGMDRSVSGPGGGCYSMAMAIMAGVVYPCMYRRPREENVCSANGGSGS